MKQELSGPIEAHGPFILLNFSQYLFRIFSSILAYVFVRVVFMSCKEVCARTLMYFGGGGGGHFKFNFLKNCPITF